MQATLSVSCSRKDNSDIEGFNRLNNQTSSHQENKAGLETVSKLTREAKFVGANECGG